MNRTKLKRLIFFSALLLFSSMPVSSAFYNPFDYQTDEEEAYTGFEDPNIESNNSINAFATLGFGGNLEEEFEIGADNDNIDAYNDAPLGNGFCILTCMVFLYVIGLKIKKN